MSETSLPFVQLVLSVQAGVMIHLGKIASPITGKIDRDLAQAKASIDLLDALRQKTEGNLSAEEKQLLDRALYELRMNYVHELSKGEETESAVNSAPEPTDN